jgi:hypothetical protein
MPIERAVNNFEFRWFNEDTVNCYITGWFLGIGAPPPTRCPYILEHAVNITA